MKDVFLRGPSGSSLVRSDIFRVAFCSHQHSLPNKSIMVSNSQPMELKVQPFLRSQLKCQNCFCH